MKPGKFDATVLTFGFAFLYIPIIILVIYSFNESRLVTVWGGFSLKWYAQLWSNEGLMSAAWVTARVGLLSATFGTVLGTLAALALVRYGRFPGRLLFSGMVYAPLVMPEVITGLSLLLLFVSLGIDRSLMTVTIAHTTFTMCYVAIVVQSRLLTFDTSLEEAALDLGSPPVKTFFKITLPLIMPAVVSGWMLAFTLSLDDLVIASFTTGPGATTLPIKIYSQVRLGVTPEINAVCSILIGLVTIGVIVASITTKRRELQRQRDEHVAAQAACRSLAQRTFAPFEMICRRQGDGGEHRVRPGAADEETQGRKVLVPCPVAGGKFGGKRERVIGIGNDAGDRQRFVATGKAGLQHFGGSVREACTVVEPVIGHRSLAAGAQLEIGTRPGQIADRCHIDAGQCAALRSEGEGAGHGGKAWRPARLAGFQRKIHRSLAARHRAGDCKMVGDGGEIGIPDRQRQIAAAGETAAGSDEACSQVAALKRRVGNVELCRLAGCEDAGSHVAQFEGGQVGAIGRQRQV
jgi:putrescine transport system permease protein